MTPRIIGFTVVAAVGLAASLAAQNPTSTNPSGAVMSDKTHEVTVTGCVAKQADGTFMLTDAAIQPSTVPTGTTGSAGSPPRAGTVPTDSAIASPPTANTLMNTGMTWMLSGESNLDQHLGHKVQIMGRTTWDASKPAPATDAPPASPTAEPTTIVIRPVMDVGTVKMLSATCP